METDTMTVEPRKTGGYVFDTQATHSLKTLKEQMAKDHIASDVGDPIRITYAPSSTGYKTTKVLEGRIIDVGRGYEPDVTIGTRDGVRVIRQGIEHDGDIQVCGINKYGNQYQLGSVPAAGFDGKIELLIEEWDLVNVDAEGRRRANR